MSKEPQLTPADRELEAALSSLVPGRHTIDRDALMFGLGRRSARRAGHRWRAAAAVLAAALAGVAIFRPTPQTIERGQYVQRDAPAEHVTSATFTAHVPASPTATTGGGEYLKLRDAVLEHGLDALPAPPVFTGTFDMPDEILQLLNRPRRTPRPGHWFNQWPIAGGQS